MVFTAKSPKIDIEEVRSLSKLEGQVLANKLQRDQELEADGRPPEGNCRRYPQGSQATLTGRARTKA